MIMSPEPKMGVATFIRMIEKAVTASKEQKIALYSLNPPIKDHDGKKHRYVIVSSIVAYFTGPETYIFPATKSGEITSWGELPGSMQGTMEAKDALECAGYTVQNGIERARKIIKEKKNERRKPSRNA